MYVPVRVYSEENAVLNHSHELAVFGRKALIVTGKVSSRKNGSLDDVISALKMHGREFTVFDKTEENPCVGTAVMCARQGIEEGADFVIGVGGGSPLDTAKAAAFLMKHPKNGKELLYQTGDDSHFPLVLVPTTCGTGSEVTQYSVLLREELKVKKSILHSVFAGLALIDGRYLKSAPLTIIRNTALDSFCHLVESRINKRADSYSRMFVDSGLLLWGKNRSALESGTDDPAVYQSLIDASAMAGMAIAQTSTTVPHGLSYYLTINMGIPHGKAVGYFIAGYLSAAHESEREYILKKAGFSSLDDFQEFYLRICGKTEVSRELLSAASEGMLKNPQKLSPVPFNIDRDVMEKMVFFTSNHIN